MTMRSSDTMQGALFTLAKLREQRRYDVRFGWLVGLAIGRLSPAC